LQPGLSERDKVRITEIVRSIVERDPGRFARIQNAEILHEAFFWTFINSVEELFSIPPANFLDHADVYGDPRLDEWSTIEFPLWYSDEEASDYYVTIDIHSTENPPLLRVKSFRIR
jgi:hypothetical protein